MVTKEMLMRGKRVAELEDSTYRKIAGKIHAHVGRHIRVETNRNRDKNTVEIWSFHPKIVQQALVNILGPLETKE